MISLINTVVMVRYFAYLSLTGKGITTQTIMFYIYIHKNNISTKDRSTNMNL